VQLGEQQQVGVLHLGVLDLAHHVALDIVPDVRVVDVLARRHERALHLAQVRALGRDEGLARALLDEVVGRGPPGVLAVGHGRRGGWARTRGGLGGVALSTREEAP
jgi:hypothetical protein